MTNKEQMQYEGLRQYIDKVNDIAKEASKDFESQISEIDQRAEELSKPLDETWKEWQPASKLIPHGSELTVVRIDEDENGRVLLVSHHSEIGAIGLWLPDGGVEASPAVQSKSMNLESRSPLQQTDYAISTISVVLSLLKIQILFRLSQRQMKF